jgi:hypothetical protein
MLNYHLVLLVVHRVHFAMSFATIKSIPNPNRHPKTNLNSNLKTNPKINSKTSHSPKLAMDTVKW